LGPEWWRWWRWRWWQRRLRRIGGASASSTGGGASGATKPWVGRCVKPRVGRRCLKPWVGRICKPDWRCIAQPGQSGDSAAASRGTTATGTNTAGTAQSTGSGPQGSTTVGRAGNPAGGTSSGRIDGKRHPVLRCRAMPKYAPRTLRIPTSIERSRASAKAVKVVIRTPGSPASNRGRPRFEVRGRASRT
jgi:hypothetical protein